MKALIVGAAGQLGRALQQVAPGDAVVTAPPEAECDLTDASRVVHWLEQVRPDVVFNAAAYTAVDAAEHDIAAAEQVNASAVVQLTAAAARCHVKLVHVSTDFVFDGEAGRPYRIDDAPNPLNVYGRTKLAGERAALSVPSNLVVRTAWVYAAGGRNFVQTMLRLMVERDEVRVVADQVSTPTLAGDLAAALWALVGNGADGLYHFTDEGLASWYDFAVAIRVEALALGFPVKAGCVVPIATADYPTPARRPHYSVLDKTRTHAVIGVGRHWREALRETMEKIAHA